MDWKAPPHGRFPQDNRGNVTTLFVALSLPIVLAAGGALDYAMAVNMKNKMQNALDAATTAVCSDPSKLPEDTLRDRLSESISEFGLSLMPPPVPGETQGEPSGNQALVLNTAFDTSTGSMIPSLKTNMPTSVLGLAGIDTMELTATTSIKCGAKHLELSLVLDVTGSMGSRVNGIRKIDSLKTAANDVFDIFERNMQLGAARIALVPFSEAVNVGPTLAPVVRGNKPSRKRFRRRSSGHYRYSTYRLTNCVTERTGAQAYTDAAPGSGSYVGPMYNYRSSCKPSQQVVPLTNDTAHLRTIINNLVASGSTAGHIGNAWGWYMLNPNWASVFPAASAPEPRNDDELIKATILMTDGYYNTQYCQGVRDSTINCRSPNGSSFNQSARLCSAMKAKGVVVYAVGFGLNPYSSAARKLKACASDDTKWFFPYNGQQLRSAFQSIGQQLAAGQAGQAVINQ